MRFARRHDLLDRATVLCDAPLTPPASMGDFCPLGCTPCRPSTVWYGHAPYRFRCVISPMPGSCAMAEANPQELGFLAKLTIGLAIVLAVAGVLWRGITVENIQRIWHNMVEAPSGPMAFRFILQPSMAAIAAIMDGIKDGRSGRSPFFRTVLTNPQERIGRLREGLDATARIMLLAIAMDVIYQLLVLKRFYPVETLIIALVLAFLPYVVIRGPVARFTRRRHDGPSAHTVE
jgi:hypothetical protein